MAGIIAIRLTRLLVGGVLALYVESASAFGQFRPQTSGATAQLRGVSAVSNLVAWASGSNGTFLRTTDGGLNWTVGTVPDASALDFRDIEADARTAYLLATAGKIYKTTDGGEHWSLQYDNTSPGVFLDAAGTAQASLSCPELRSSSQSDRRARTSRPTAAQTGRRSARMAITA